MTKEDKELLLKDLCARLPYGVNVKTTGDNESYILLSINSNKNIALIGLNFDGVYATSKIKIDDVKPYLRPMSSMTDEEKSEFINYACYEVEESVNGRHYEYYLKDFVGTKEEPIANVDAIDWLNAHHFDYRGLIPKGLAIEASEENNPYKD